MDAPGPRLTPERRRSHLLDVAAELFAHRGYDDVLVEDVAASAGVSRGLVYRYFATKRDLFAAVFQRDSTRLLDATRLDADLPLVQQVRDGLDAHLDYFTAHRRTILTVNRGALSGDPAVQAIVSDELAVLRDRLLAATGVQGRKRRVVALALLGWLAFVRAVCVEWLEHGAVSRAEVREVCLHALAGALGDSVDLQAGS